MNARLLVYRFFLGIAVALPLFAQSSPRDELALGAQLNDRGQFSEAIRAVEPLLSSQSPSLEAAGIAWNIRGVALENLGDWEGARRSYETAVAMLRARPDQIRQYASALDNLGSLKADMGQWQESRSLRFRAWHLYRSIDDHAGAARASVNLAFVALGQGDRKHAGKFLAEARSEESLVSDPDPSDLAALSAVQALASIRNGHLNEALDAINRAVELWTRRYGPDYYILATGLSLRGQIDSALLMRNNAQADLKRSLDILKTNNEADSRVYFIVERSYASVLRDSGDHDEADKLEADANRGLATLREKECNGCSISAASFR
jgi:tetratricopeptide (TPR) repeat protein